MEKCPSCEETFKKTSRHSLWRHKIVAHRRANFQCPKCNYKATFAKDLKGHMIEEGHTSNPNIKCPWCCVIVNFMEIEEHFNECVKKPISLIFRMRKSRLSNQIPSQSDCNDGSISKISRKKTTKTKQFLVCPWCPFQVKCWSTFENHKKSAHFWGRFKCRVCKAPADFAKALVDHIESECHNEDTSVDCPSCEENIPLSQIVLHYEKCIAGQKEIRLHLKRQELGDQRSCCTICGKSIKIHCMKSHLQMHMRKQGDEKTNTDLYHYCDKCGKRFAFKRDLKEHVRLVHEGFRYNCDTCNILFTSKHQFKNHNAREHSLGSIFQCEFCSYCCINTTDRIQNHMLSHEEPKFKCRYCGKRIKTQQNLTAHERIHTGEKPYPCSHCNTSFASNSGLNQHMRGVHKVAPMGGQTGWCYGKKANKRSP